MRAKDDQNTFVSGNAGLRPWNLSVEPSMMIRRAKEHASRVGLISEKIFQNSVNGTLLSYTRSRQEDLCAENLGMKLSYYNENSNKATGTWTNVLNDAEPDYEYRGNVTPFFQLSTPSELGETVDSSKPSMMLTPEIYIPMTHVSALANSHNARNQIPVAALGDLMYEFELDNRVRCAEYLEVSTWDCEDATVGAGGDVPLQLSYQFEDNVDLKKLDLGIGIRVKIAYTGGTAAGSSTVGTISTIAVAANGTTTVTVEGTSLNNGDTITGVTLTYDDAPATPPEYEITDWWIESHNLQLTPQQIDNATKALDNLVITFPDYYLKPEQMSDQSIYFEQTMQVPKGSRGVAVLTPQNITQADQAERLYSGFNKAQFYRFQVTDERGVLMPTTNREVQVYQATGRFDGSSDEKDYWTNRGLHNIRLKDYFANVGMPLKKYDLYEKTNSNKNLGFYPQMLIPSNEQNAMNFILRTDGQEEMDGKTVLFVFNRDRAIRMEQGRPVLVN
jgi:hypothetical protein